MKLLNQPNTGTIKDSMINKTIDAFATHIGAPFTLEIQQAVGLKWVDLSPEAMAYAQKRVPLIIDVPVLDHFLELYGDEAFPSLHKLTGTKKGNAPQAEENPSGEGLKMPKLEGQKKSSWEPMLDKLPTFKLLGEKLPVIKFQTWAYPYALLARRDMPDNQVKGLLEALFEPVGMIMLADGSYRGHQTTLDMATNTQAHILPYHPAAVSFFKEKGTWSAENEAIQNSFPVRSPNNMLQKQQQTISSKQK